MQLVALLDVSRKDAEARKVLEDGLQRYPKSERLLVAMGNRLLKKREFKEAVPYLRRAAAAVEARDADPDGFAASLLPEDTVPEEVRGPGCD